MENITLVSGQNGFYSLDNKTGIVSQIYKDSNSSKNGVSYVSNSSSYLAGFQANKSILHLWNVKSEPIYRVSLPEVVGCCTFQDDGGVVYAGGLSGTIYVWVLSTGQLLNCWLSHYKPIVKMELIQDNSILVTCSDDSCLQAFLVNEILESNYFLRCPKPILKWSAHSAAINDFFSFPSANKFSDLSIISVGSDFTLNLFTFKSERAIVSLNFSTQLHSCTISECGKLIFVGAGNGIIYRIPSHEPKDLSLNNISRMVGHNGSINICRYANNKVYSSAIDGVRIWDVLTGSCITHLPQFGGGIISIIITKASFRYSSLSFLRLKPFQRNISCYKKLVGISIPAIDRSPQIKKEMYLCSHESDYNCYTYKSKSQFYELQELRLKNRKIVADTASQEIMKKAIDRCIHLESSLLNSIFNTQNSLDKSNLMVKSAHPIKKYYEIKNNGVRGKRSNSKIGNCNFSQKIHSRFFRVRTLSKLSKLIEYNRILSQKIPKLSRQ
ncbi:WD40 repeat-containing protein [Cryptosporidium felis]|nr:WD40 repeat-containing protein [Cryptosporidium felis]